MKEVYTLEDLASRDLLDAGANKPARLAVIGHPIAHSASPKMHQAALDEFGNNLRYIRLDIEPATTQGLLREYIAASNDLAANPRWYHTLATNCTTVIYGMARRLDPRVAMDWRILLPGRLPEYLQKHAFVTRSLPLGDLVARGRIGERAAATYPDSDFSARIRREVPMGSNSK